MYFNQWAQNQQQNSSDEINRSTSSDGLVNQSTTGVNTNRNNSNENDQNGQRPRHPPKIDRRGPPPRHGPPPRPGPPPRHGPPPGHGGRGPPPPPPDNLKNRRAEGADDSNERNNSNNSTNTVVRNRATREIRLEKNDVRSFDGLQKQAGKIWNNWVW